MATNINISVDRSDLREVIRALDGIRNGAPRALKGAVNRTLQGVKTSMARETSKVLALPQRRIKKDIHIAKRASTSDFSGRVTSKGQPVSLHSFGAREKKRGVSVKVLKSEGRKTIEGAFIFMAKYTEKKTGKKKINLMVGWREKTAENAGQIGSKKRKPWMEYAALPPRYRYPVEALHGPRIQDITSRPEVIGAVEEAGRERLKKELASQVDRLLDRQRI